jgi:2-phosphosulfolactate phosphatase
MMNNMLDVFSTNVSLTEEDARGKTVVVIDVLRASSTIITGLVNGARGVIPAEDMGTAGKIAQNLDPSRYLLCGERDGKQIEGYTMGNSPSEYTAEAVLDKTLILTTTNGTKAIARAHMASVVIIAGFLNADAVVEYLKTVENEILIVCSGWKGRLSLEDMLCAGYIVHALSGGTLPDEAKDGARAAMGLYERYRNELQETVSATNHARRLQSLGYGDDIAFCCTLNRYDVVPKIDDGIIRI